MQGRKEALFSLCRHIFPPERNVQTSQRKRQLKIIRLKTIFSTQLISWKIVDYWKCHAGFSKLHIMRRQVGSSSYL